ncbi:uncharacterized protein DUF2812 [Anaerobacterium chartisolvens]|uniref:Uncharacterized protein DUF2812 n=1 Tax=Anaerobacterium chartisolvens TaxID=1297424 RepID=A0A369BBC3_9FIRM|nr:DUF2812 domain-containing protein [Anaerobacterium chartisolvens]RCX18832.1 uncharacterized protein DUF2812 [Anaerobacterium chartisolvens]
MDKKTVWFALFRNVVPADYESWMEKLASEGWNVNKIGQFSSIKMTFNKTSPKKYRYVFDLNAFPRKDYIDIYKQFGWELVGKMSSCFVWRKEYEGVRPESFTDKESIIKRNKRTRNAVAACMILLLAGTLGTLAGIGIKIYFGKTGGIPELVLQAVFLGTVSYYLWRVVAKIQQSIER